MVVSLCVARSPPAPCTMMSPLAPPSTPAIWGGRRVAAETTAASGHGRSPAAIAPVVDISRALRSAMVLGSLVARYRRMRSE